MAFGILRVLRLPAWLKAGAARGARIIVLEHNIFSSCLISLPMLSYSAQQRKESATLAWQR